MIFTLILLLTVFNTAKSADTDACGKELVYRSPSISEDSILQKLLLKGFRSAEPEGVNSYSCRSGGFNSKGGDQNCIAVTYNIMCGENTSSICHQSQCDMQNNADPWIYLWTSFNSSSQTGNLLLKLNVFDLRVFGFSELCDAYNNKVDINIKLDSEEQIPPGCYDLNAALIDFTRLLPGLSDELGSEESDGKVPNTEGYAIRWCDEDDLKTKGDNELKTFSIILVFTSKFFILIFSYELYHQLRDNSIHQKTHDWYYVYWATQLVIVVGIGLLIHFARENQKNIVAVNIFYISLAIDGILTIVTTIVLIVIEFKKDHQDKMANSTKTDVPKQKPSSSDTAVGTRGKDPDPNIHKDGTVDLVPPPLGLLWTILWNCICNLKQSRARAHENKGVKTPLISKAKSSLNCCQSIWKILLNGVSLFTFLAFLSYLTQAIPSIAISYYLSPTTSLIRLGYYELMIIVMLGEGAYLLYLLDKFLWLLHIHYYEAIPEEIDEERDITSKNGYENKSDSDKSSNDKVKYVDRYLVEGKLPKLIPLPFVRKSRHSFSCSKKFHWLFVITILQIVAFGFVIYVSWKLLHFILTIIIEQTSNPNNNYNEILAILPTIAVNGWFLFKKGDVMHTLKDVMSKAIKSTMEHKA